MRSRLGRGDTKNEKHDFQLYITKTESSRKRSEGKCEMILMQSFAIQNIHETDFLQ